MPHVEGVVSVVHLPPRLPVAAAVEEGEVSGGGLLGSSHHRVGSGAGGDAVEDHLQSLKEGRRKEGRKEGGKEGRKEGVVHVY